MAVDKARSTEKLLTDGRMAVRWGAPPLALIPDALAKRLASVALPEWLIELLDGNASSPGGLTADAWDRLPSDNSIRQKVTSYVLGLVGAHATDLYDVPIGALVGLDALQLERWPARARNALLNVGVRRDSARLAALTFGEVLSVPNIGVQTALETAALLELFLSGVPGENYRDGACVDSSAGSDSRVTSPRWGKPGSALLPQTLRRALAGEVLPGWLAEDLHLPAESTALALDTSVWRHLDALPLRAERFVLGLLMYRADEFRDLRVLDGEWPAGIDPKAMPWPTRVHNALARGHLLGRTQLERVTYGELLDLPAMGVKSVLEVAVMAESVPSTSVASAFDATTRQELTAAAEEEWAERVRADDFRFRDVAPPYGGSLSELFEDALNNPAGRRAHAIVEALPRIRARAEEVASEPIDIALTRLLRNAGATGRDIAITAARVGWRSGKRATLQEVGEEFSITRERVRQIVSRTIDRIGNTYLPQVERAAKLVTDHAPIAAEAAARLLVEEGLSSEPLDPAFLKMAAERLGYDVAVHVDYSGGGACVMAGDLTGTGPILLAARREAGRTGVSNVEEVTAKLGGHELSEEAVARVLQSSTKVAFLEADWFWMPEIPADRNRLRNLTQKMLAVTPRLDVATLRQGVRRGYRYRNIDLVPPSSALIAFYRAHPEFVVLDDGTVESVNLLDYRDLLGDVEQVFVKVLRASPTGLLDRADFEEAVTERGVNPNTFSVFCTYSPILDHPAVNVWCLRGHTVDPAHLEALRAVSATRPRERRTLDHGWDEDGKLRLTVRVGNINSPVIGIPSSIARYLAGRRFDGITQEGTRTGVIVVDDGGTSWGYGPFLRRRGAEPGDALTLRFELDAEQVTLTLGEDATLDDNAA
jgi:hypothetical protein